MDNHLSPKISSFVLRFTQEDPDSKANQLVVRGSIRHVQTNQELSFIYWAEAVAFMSQFVPVEYFDFSNTTMSEPNNQEDC